MAQGMAERVASRYLQASGVVTLPRGSVLYHGSLEPFAGRLQPGGDGLVWFADTPAIAQLYIPRAGLSMSVSPRDLTRPTKDPQAQAIQQMLGIEYDMDKVQWNGWQVRSFSGPKGWDHLPTEREVERLLESKGYEKGPYGSYDFLFHQGRVLSPKETATGRLFTAITKRDLLLWAKAGAEGDLTDVEYNDIGGFKDAEKQGLDGVLIQDFAQSKEWGNLGHMSVGLFKGTIDDLSVKSVPAPYREWDHNHQTPEAPHAKGPYFNKL